MQKIWDLYCWDFCYYPDTMDVKGLLFVVVRAVKTNIWKSQQWRVFPEIKFQIKIISKLYCDWNKILFTSILLRWIKISVCYNQMVLILEGLHQIILEFFRNRQHSHPLHAAIGQVCRGEKQWRMWSSHFCFFTQLPLSLYTNKCNAINAFEDRLSWKCALLSPYLNDYHISPPRFSCVAIRNS